MYLKKRLLCSSKLYFQFSKQIHVTLKIVPTYIMHTIKIIPIKEFKIIFFIIYKLTLVIIIEISILLKTKIFIYYFREHYHFVVLCLKMLSTHLSLAVAGGMTNVLLGQQASPLRNLLFRLIDSNLPQSIHEVLFVIQSIWSSMVLE